MRSWTAMSWPIYETRIRPDPQNVGGLPTAPKSGLKQQPVVARSQKRLSSRSGFGRGVRGGWCEPTVRRKRSSAASWAVL